MLLVAVVVVGLIGWWWFTQETVELDPIEALPQEVVETDELTVEPVVEEAVEVATEPDHIFVMEATGREFIVDGVSNPELTVSQGDLVRIEFTVTGGTHDLVIEELGVATAVLSAGQTEVVEFVATTVGSFEYLCSVGNHYAEGMFGVINVVE